MGKEIERKYKISYLPNCDNYKCFHVAQNYLVANDRIEVRIHNKIPIKSPLQPEISMAHDWPVDYELTIKTSGLLERDEIKIPIDSTTFNALGKLCPGDFIYKFHYEYPLPNGLTLEANVVDQNWMYAEIEFPDLESAQNYEGFPFPECQAVDMTDNPLYKMKNYWERTKIHSK